MRPGPQVLNKWEIIFYYGIKFVDLVDSNLATYCKMIGLSGCG